MSIYTIILLYYLYYYQNVIFRERQRKSYFSADAGSSEEQDPHFRRAPCLNMTVFLVVPLRLYYNTCISIYNDRYDILSGVPSFYQKYN